MADWQTYLSENRSRFLDELLDFLRIPSISALPEHAQDVRAAASWIADRLKKASIENVQIHETGGHPVVYGDWLHAGDQPTIMIYGHFDTQPVDPLDLWEHPPFEPTVEGDRIYARGASDDKGNLFVPVLAAEALLESEGELPVNVKFFLEGQEEIGSPQLPAFIADHKELLACDLILSADSGQWSATEPSVLVGLRGICGLQLDVYGPERDLHSGSYGGAVQNPLHALVRLLDSMRAPDGRILVEGFYDNVFEPTDEIREQVAAVPFDEEDYKEDLGVDALFGEPGFTPPERTWIRPTLELNGVYGGFQGQGLKTVLPSEAHAKITCRLVPDQDPERIAALIIEHVAEHTPPGVRAEVSRAEHGAVAYSIPVDHPGLEIAAELLEDIYDQKPYYVRTGGSVPVTSFFLEHLGAYTIGFGFALPDERIHSPNEFFRISSLERGQEAYCRMLHALRDAEL